MVVTLSAVGGQGGGDTLDLVALDQALVRLEAEEGLRAARVLQLHILSAMTRDEISEALALSPATVGRDRRFSRAFVNQALT